MNRRNWLKTIAALAAGVVTAPLALKERILSGPNYDAVLGERKELKRHRWFVDSDYRGSAPDGSLNRPFSTLDAALKQAQSGSTIFVLAGHTEAISGVVLDKPVTIQGLGSAGSRPRFSSTGDGPMLLVDANDCHIEGLDF